jgi:hypothetical protein
MEVAGRGSPKLCAQMHLATDFLSLPNLRGEHLKKSLCQLPSGEPALRIRS